MKTPGSDVLGTDCRALVRETFCRHVRPFSSDRLAHHVRLDSNSLFSSWRATEHKIALFGKNATLTLNG
jgi:hypothetical protein